MKKNMHAKTLAIVLATTTALQMTGMTSRILYGVPFVTANAAVFDDVKINGTEEVGETLTADLYLGDTKTTIGGVTYTWYKIDKGDDHNNKSDIKAGNKLSNTGATYKVGSSDEDDYIGVIVSYVTDEVYDITGDIDDYDDDYDYDDYELSSLELLNSNNETIKLYDDDDYEDSVDEDDVDSSNTYYAKTSSNSIHIDASGVDDDNIKVFKGTSNSTKGKDADEAISISGDTTIVVRTYDEDVADETVTYDDDYEEEYTIKVKYTGSGSAATNNTETNNTVVNNNLIPSIGFQTTSNGTRKIIENGKFVTGWKSIGGYLYLADSTGTVLTGWQFVNGRWYLLNSSGAMVTGWQFTNGKWYLLSSSGPMLTGWQQTNGKWYYLYSNGSMASNTVINGYKLDITGAWY